MHVLPSLMPGCTAASCTLAWTRAPRRRTTRASPLACAEMNVADVGHIEALELTTGRGLDARGAGGVGAR